MTDIKKRFCVNKIAELIDFGFQGITYWATVEACSKPFNFDLERLNDLFKDTCSGWFAAGGTLYITDDIDNIKLEIRNEHISNGLLIMSEKYPDKFQEFISGKFDEDTGDLFMQCVCFEEVIYG